MKISLQTLFKLVLAIVLCFTSSAHAGSIAVADAGLLVSLHPEMARFDFDRMGFFKLPLGLSSEEWYSRLEELKNQPDDPKLLASQNDLKKQLSELESQKGAILSQFGGLSPAKAKEFETQLKKLNESDSNIRKKLKEIHYCLSCKDLTSPEETRKILDKIESETLETIAEVAKERGFEVVLNANIPVPFAYPQNYETNEMYGIGIPGIDQTLFYAFIATENEEAQKFAENEPSSLKLINWLELTKFPKAQNLLPLKPYPLVLSGGKRIDLDVLKVIYSKYKISNKIFPVLESIFETIENHTKTFDSIVPEKPEKPEK